MIELREVTKEYSVYFDQAYHERTGTYFGNDYCKWQ